MFRRVDLDLLVLFRNVNRLFALGTRTLLAGEFVADLKTLVAILANYNNSHASWGQRPG